MEIKKLSKKTIRIQNPKKETIYEFEQDITKKTDKEIQRFINERKFRILEETIIV